MLVNKIECVPETLEGNPRVMKFNIPEDIEGYQRGNGEGVWGYIENESALEQYDKGIGEFSVILLNDTIYHPILEYGIVCVVEGRGQNRPIVNWDWLQSVIK